ncbi:CDP-alcohol phosphatidyltransferase family protein [Sphaerobacter thermophilus]|uniref:CDP-diacylglycerol--glycerol-3-phosphate 3-phosphatidyltransferase n=1 Tax=Sphaerobacter thermophilus (strain ATCC 49802 / DSM 20745 / KCCM 41009 / NCIMB 13125 / S 6022) TaxID=479434 RepID=D1C3R3_SPHTD|nr:CDP-alcohol phosphatidyltransferase family protein [Sphaerobacter thermophilus]ACZ38880.1 CDP-alcohol phosphatidyltransferase [Sphaerobacter thermophilus DSM 20745]PZN64833.1 MAG: CDP-alcohol phosphatidyltransferase family protein [Sphaerobacter thermophilus]
MANLITIGRLVLLFVTIALIYTHSYPLALLSIGLIVVVFLSDGLDGFVARRRNSTSEFGAVLDIAGDRVVENALWIVFAELGLIGVWAPLVVMTRGFLVDAMRSVGYSQGKSAFGANTMMLTPLSRFLTASRFMRAFYGAAKGLGFVFLTGLFAAGLPDAVGTSFAALYDQQWVRIAGWFMVYAALALTIVRGVPVLFDAMYYVRGYDKQCQ